jgi:hypothetical protein
MRKCRSCGSLLLGDVEACARCGAPLPVAVGASPAIAASASGSPSAPPAPPAAPLPPATGPAPAQSAPAVPSYGRLSIPAPVPVAPVGTSPSGGGSTGAPPLREAWQPVAIAVPVAAPRKKPWARVALALAVIIVVGAGILHLRSDPLPAGTSAFVAGNGVTYTSPDGVFQVQLPQNPQVEHETISVNGLSAPFYLGLVTSDSYEMGAASVVYPGSFDPARVNDALDAMATQGVKGANGTSVVKTPTMHGAEPAIDVKFKAGDGYSGRMLVVANGGSVVMLIVHAKSGTDRLFKALEESLLIR